MRVTDYGRELARATDDAAALAAATDGLSGASAHAAACGTDTGLWIVLTGRDYDGRPIRRHASSVAGAYMMMTAAWGFKRAWHFRADGTRRLVIAS